MISEESRKVLIVDDNRDLCESLMDVFNHFGHTVDCAYDGQQAVQKVLRNPPHVVLMDVQMPLMDGITALRIVKQIASPTPRVLLMTANPDPKTTELAIREGAEAVLGKPIDPSHVLRIIAETKR